MVQIRRKLVSLSRIMDEQVSLDFYTKLPKVNIFNVRAMGQIVNCWRLGWPKLYLRGKEWCSNIVAVTDVDAIYSDCKSVS